MVFSEDLSRLVTMPAGLCWLSNTATVYLETRTVCGALSRSRRVRPVARYVSSWSKIPRRLSSHRLSPRCWKPIEIDEIIHVRVSGGRFAAWLELRGHGRVLDIKAQMRPAGATTEDVRESYNSLHAILNRGGELQILGLGENLAWRCRVARAQAGGAMNVSRGFSMR